MKPNFRNRFMKKLTRVVLILSATFRTHQSNGLPQRYHRRRRCITFCRVIFDFCRGLSPPLVFSRLSSWLVSRRTVDLSSAVVQPVIRLFVIVSAFVPPDTGLCIPLARVQSTRHCSVRASFSVSGTLVRPSCEDVRAMRIYLRNDRFPEIT